MVMIVSTLKGFPGVELNEMMSSKQLVRTWLPKTVALVVLYTLKSLIFFGRVTNNLSKWVAIVLTVKSLSNQVNKSYIPKVQILALLGLAHPVARSLYERPRLLHCPALLSWHLSLGSNPSWSQDGCRSPDTTYSLATAEKPDEITSFLVLPSNLPRNFFPRSLRQTSFPILLVRILTFLSQRVWCWGTAWQGSSGSGEAAAIRRLA